MEEKKYTRELVSSLIEDEKVLEHAFQELITVYYLNEKRSDDSFLTAYTGFKEQIIKHIQDTKNRKGQLLLSNLREAGLNFIINNLPHKDKVEKPLHQMKYASNEGVLDAYSFISDRKDIGEIYAIYSIFALAEQSQKKDIKIASTPLEEAVDKDVYARSLREMIMDIAPFSGPKLELFKAQTLETKYLDDDINAVTEGDVVARFYTACGMRNSRMALKLLGDIRRISPEEAQYLEAFIDYYDEQYEDALHYIKRIEVGSTYYDKALLLELECLSMMGDEKAFLELIDDKEKAPVFTFDYIRYCSQLLIMNSEKLENSIFEIVDNNKKKYQQTCDRYYRDKTRRRGFQALVDGVVVLREYGWKTTLDEKLPLKEEDIIQLDKFNDVAQFLLPGSVFFYTGNNKEAITYGSDIITIAANISIMVRDKYVGSSNSKGPSIDNPRFEDQLFAFECMYEMGLYRAFYTQVNYNLDWLKSLITVPEVKSLLQKAYVEALALGIDNEDFNAIASELQDDNKEIITNSRMRNILPYFAWRAYEAAEWGYKKSKEEPYGWKDAGMISLSYFRIIEMIINEWFINPLAKEMGEKIERTFESHKKDVDDKAANNYSRKWGTIVKNLRDKNCNDDADNLMLGPIEHFFKAIGRNYKEKEPVAMLIKGFYKDYLAKEAYEAAINKHGVEQIIKKSIRDKFRNPPAHCKYLPYETACECREYVNDSIETLFLWTHDESYRESVI